MLWKIFLPVIFAVLTYGFWISSDFKEIAAGVAIFLFGMLSLEEGFKVFTGGLLEKLLKKTTDRIWKSLAFGVVSTSVMQSSSLVSVITISFLSAGLIPLISGVGIIFGANLGTTTGAWLLAGFGLKIKISAYAMPMLVFGVILLFQKVKELKGVGYILAGLGFIFLGIHHMKAGFETFADQIDLTTYAVSGYPGVLLFVAVGIGATVVMQSSHATLVLILTALSAGQLTYENALAVAVGANVGTTITAIIGSMSSNVEGRRLAAAHLVFNAATATVAVLLVYRLTGLVEVTSSWLGIAPSNDTLKLAVFHTLFNLLGVLLMLPFLKPLVNVLGRVITPRRGAKAAPYYLTDAASGFADTAIEALRHETLHLYENAFQIISKGIRLNPADIVSSRPLEDVVRDSTRSSSISIDEKYEEDIKQLHADIIAFAGRAQARMTPLQTEELYALRTAGREIIEAIKGTKHLQKNLERFIASDHAAIRSEYRTIRVQIATVLRQLNEIRAGGEHVVTSVALDSLLSDISRQKRQNDKRLDLLISDGSVSATAVTSLMNDHSYAAEVSEKLLRMASVLFDDGDLETRAAGRSVSLGRQEMSEALEPSNNPPHTPS